MFGRSRSFAAGKDGGMSDADVQATLDHQHDKAPDPSPAPDIDLADGVS